MHATYTIALATTTQHNIAPSLRHAAMFVPCNCTWTTALVHYNHRRAIFRYADADSIRHLVWLKSRFTQLIYDDLLVRWLIDWGALPSGVVCIDQPLTENMSAFDEQYPVM